MDDASTTIFATWIAGIGVIIALAALPFTIRAAAAAKRQTDIQDRIRKDAAQPYVWAGLLPDDETSSIMLLTVCNAGPTVATDIKVTFDPPLEMPHSKRSEESQRILSRGIPSLPPGRSMTWSLGVAWDAIPKGRENVYNVTIQSKGPFGDCEPLTYEINLEDLRLSRAVPTGTLNGVKVGLKEINDTLKKASN